MTDPLDPARSAVVVVDMQTAFADPEGSLYAPGSERAVDPITDLVGRARAAGARIVYTRDVHPPEQFADTHSYNEFERWGEHTLEGSPDAALLADLDVREEDLVVEKHTYDAFYDTQLEGWLRARGIRNLVLCGTLANVCVLHTAGSAGLRDFRSLLVSDCIGAIEENHKEYALEHAAWLFGEVAPRSEVEFAR